MRTKENQKIYNKSYGLRNKEKINARKKEYYLANKEVVALRNKIQYQKNKEIRLEKQKIYNDENKAKKAVYDTEYRIKNKEKRDVWGAEYRLLKNNALAAMTKEEKENYANLVKIRDDATKLFGYEWHIDHTIPLSLGGTNTIDNLEVVPALWNISKKNRNSDSYWGWHYK